MLFCLLFFDYLENKRKPKTEVFFPAVTSPRDGNSSGKTITDFIKVYKFLFNQAYREVSAPYTHLYS